jgi:glutamate:GABA antiporter
VTTPATSESDRRVREVEARSTGFRRELGLVDLALAQIVFVVGTGWVGTAAKLGNAHIAFWLAAIALYYLPQAMVVVYLNRLMPLEGGLYQWATVGLGDFAGFMTAWNLWAFSLAVMGTFAIGIATNISYLFGSGLRAVTTSGMYTPLVSSTVIVATSLIAVLGLRASKWLQNVGGIAQFVTYAALLVVPLFALRRGAIESFHPLAASAPALSAYNLNIFGKLALGALSGFEYVALLAGECRDPARTISRSVFVAAPVIALMFVFGTSSVVALVPRDAIDLVSPIPQALTIGFAGYRFASLIVPALILFVLLRQFGSVTLIFAGTTRLPMVAGWDGLLPRRFTELHPRYRTPIYSIGVVGVITLAFALAGQIGVGLQEAYQVVENVSGILYAFAYAALFAIPLVAAKRLAEPPPLWLRVAAASGLAVTVLYSVLSIFPIIDVPNWHLFTAKIVVALVLVQGIGLALYVAGRRRMGH